MQTPSPDRLTSEAEKTTADMAARMAKRLEPFGVKVKRVVRRQG